MLTVVGSGPVSIVVSGGTVSIGGAITLQVCVAGVGSLFGTCREVDRAHLERARARERRQDLDHLRVGVGALLPRRRVGVVLWAGVLAALEPEAEPRRQVVAARETECRDVARRHGGRRLREERVGRGRVGPVPSSLTERSIVQS